MFVANFIISMSSGQFIITRFVSYLSITSSKKDKFYEKLKVQGGFDVKMYRSALITLILAIIYWWEKDAFDL